MSVKKVVFLAFPHMELMDLSGPQTAFYEASLLCGDTYSLQVAGFDPQPVVCEAGAKLLPDTLLADIAECHTLVIPGGKGTRVYPDTSEHLAQLRRVIALSDRVVTICTGAFMLAKAGLEDGCKVATHWANVDELRRAYPSLNVDEHSLYVNSGKYWTSAGIAAGIDLSLKLIELDLGAAVASQVARQMVVYVKRSGSQQQYSDRLSLQSPRTDRIARLINWMKEHLSQKVTLTHMAQVVNLSERQLHRLFSAEVGISPAQYLYRLRMNEGQELLVSSDRDIKHLALSLGFESADGFRRAFEKTFGVAPMQYRQQFSTQQGGDA